MAVSAIMGAISTAGAVLGTAGGIGAFTFFGMSGIGAVATRFLVTTAMGAALNALAPKPKAPNIGSQGYQISGASGSALDHQIIYGEARVGGVRVYDASTGGNNEYLHRILAFAGHEIDSYQAIYLNDEVVTLDGSGNVTSPARYNGYVRIKDTYLGTDSQAADSDLVSETSTLTDGRWTTNHRLRGIAYIYVRFRFNADVFPNGIPSVSAKIRGRKVYDPRTTTTAWSANPALCIRDYLTSAHGLEQASGRIDDDLVEDAADICDQSIDSESRFTCNGAFTTGQEPAQILTDLLTSMGGILWYGQGKWRMKAAAWSAPTVSFDEDDLRSGISLSTRHSRRDNFNSVKGTFAGDITEWQPTDYPEVTDPAFLEADNGVPNVLDFPLPFTSSDKTAQRVARIALNRNREQLTFSASFGMRAFQVQVGDFVYINNTRFGWTNKAFEVVEWTFGLADDLDIQVNMTLREISEGVFTGAVGQAFELNNTTLPSAFSVPAVTNLQLTATSVLNSDGISIPAIRASWTPSTNAFVQYYEIQYKRLGGEEDYGSVADAHTDQEDWGSITVAFTSEEDYGLTNEPILSPDAEYVSNFGSTTSFLIQPVLNGYDYNVRVRAVNSLGVRSPFATATLASVGDTTPPNAPLSLSAVGNYKAITLSWINPADQDLDFVEVWRNNTNNLASATRIGAVKGTNFTDPNLPNNTTRFYWVRAVDYSLNTSNFSTGASATTLLIEPNDFSDAVNDLFQEAGAFGVEPVSTLPASGDFDGQLVLLLPEITIYRWDAATSTWSTDIFTASSIEAGSITYASFAAGIEPVGVVNTLPTVAGYDGPQVVVLTTDGKLYRLVDGAWTAAVNTADLEGTLGENLFSDTLRPIERVGSLPTTNLTQGRVVLLTTDNKLYRYTGNAWTSAVPATDLTGQITGTQITDNAITTTKIADLAINTAKIATGAATEAKIATNAITETKITTNAVTSAKIAAGAVVAGKIAADAVQAGNIEAGAVTTAKLAAGSVVADKIATNAVTATKISAGAVVADKIATNAVTATKIDAGAVSADKIAANAVTATKIAADAVTAGKIAANAVEADNIVSNAITTAKIAAGAVNATQIAANAITSDKIFANAVTTSKLATDSVIADKIAAGAIITSKIAAGAVTADKITVSELSAISANLGTIQVQTANIGDNQVTFTVGAYATNTVNSGAVNSPADAIILTAAINCTGAPVNISSSFFVRPLGDIDGLKNTDHEWGAQLIRVKNGVSTVVFTGWLGYARVRQTNTYGWGLGSCSFNRRDTPGAGNVTYQLRVYTSDGINGLTIYHRSMLLSELKK